jgi:phosphoribosylaminoimidazole carboxylase PurE protein
MGSASDKSKLAESGFVQILQEVLGDDLDVEYSVCSAHRNAHELSDYVDDAQTNGAKIFIGIAGMAAALPGAMAGLSHMMLPVIAVPLDADGLDSCIKMPPGVPVLTSGVGAVRLKNAAIAACQILALDPDQGGIRLRLQDYLIDAGNKKPTEFNIDPIA